MLTLATAKHTRKTLTFSPLCIRGDEFVDECDIFKSLPLSLADDFWVAAFVGAKQIQVQHHLRTLSVRERLSEPAAMTPPSGLPDPVPRVNKP